MTPMKSTYASVALASLAAALAFATPALAGDSAKHKSLTESLKDVTGAEFDQRFLSLMQEHHEHGMEMAMLAKQRAQSESLREYATKIASRQQKEIAQIERVQSDNRAASTQTLASSGTGSAARMNDDTTSPGTAAKQSMSDSRQQGEALDDLESTTGAEFDGKFIAKMTKHHQKGLELAEYGKARASEDKVKDLAEDFADSLEDELEELKELKTS